MFKSYTEEKFTVMGVQGRKQVVVLDRIKDVDTGELVECLRIQECDKPKVSGEPT